MLLQITARHIATAGQQFKGERLRLDATRRKEFPLYPSVACGRIARGCVALHKARSANNLLCVT